MADKKITTIEEAKEYLNEEYWTSGLTDKRSNYQGRDQIDWWWNLRWFQCWNQIFPVRGKYILDLGCALGEFVASCLMAGGAQAFGVDLSEYAIKKGKEIVPQLRSRIHCKSIHDLKVFKNNMFDYVYSQQVLEHLPPDLTSQLISEIYRVLKPSGIIWAGLVLGEGRGPDDPDETHINIHPREWWDERFLRQGFVKEIELDKKIRQTTCGPDNYSFFQEYGWHTICYRKK